MKKMRFAHQGTRLTVSAATDPRKGTHHAAASSDAKTADDSLLDDGSGASIG